MGGEITHPTGWLKGAVWAMGLGVPVLVTGLGVIGALGWSSALDRHDRLSEEVTATDGRVRGLSQSVARSLEHVAHHERESEYWQGRIETNSKRLEELSSNANARPDPFTGTQGRELERRIDQLERSSDQLGWIKERMVEMDERLIRSERYYRDSVVPMLNQSNALQMQRIQQGMDGEGND